MKKLALLAAGGALVLTGCGATTYTWYDVDSTVDPNDDCFSITKNVQKGEDEDNKKSELLGDYCKVTEGPSSSPTP